MRSRASSSQLLAAFLAPHEHCEQCEQRAPCTARLATAALRLALESSAARDGHALLDVDLGDVLRDEVRQLHLAALDERGVRRGLRALGDLAAIRGAAPDAAPRVVARDRSGPRVADRVATLKVVDLLLGDLAALLEPALI